MTTPQALKLFEALARQKGMDLSSDGTRFLRMTTARAWTKFQAANCK